MPILGKNAKIVSRYTIVVERNGGKLRLGDYSYINGGMIRAQGADIIIGKRCAIAHNVHMITNYGTRFFGKYKKEKIKPIRIGNYVHIGYGAMIRGGVTIGNFAIIGMGSVVVKDVPAFSVVGGNPAKVIKKREDKHIILKMIKNGEIDEEW